MITCEKCLYWEHLEHEEHEGVGFCRHSAPRAEAGVLSKEDAVPKFLLIWPVTRSDDWCGQAIPRESGSTQPVHEAAQAVVDWFDEVGSHYTGPSETVEKLREALRRMKP